MNIFLAMIPAFFWGTTYAVTQYSLPDWPPILLGCLRALPAGLILLAIRPTWPKRSDWKALSQLGLINIGLFFSMIFVMASYLPSAISGVGMVSVPVVAMLYQFFVLQTKPTTSQISSGILLIGFAWFLFDPSHLSLSPIGLIAMLVAIFCIIIGSGLTKNLGLTMHWWTVLTWQLILGGLFLGGLSMVQVAINPEPFIHAWVTLDTRNLLGVSWLIILNTVLAYGMYVWLLQRMTVVEFTFSGIANPIAGISCGMLLVGESYTLLQYGLMAGMIISSLIPALLNHLKQKQCSANGH